MMFWRKKEPTSPGPALPIISSDRTSSPRPILKSPGDVGAGPSIRFATGMNMTCNASTPLWNPSAPAPTPAPTHKVAAPQAVYPLKAPPLHIQISVTAASQAGPSSGYGPTASVYGGPIGMGGALPRGQPAPVRPSPVVTRAVGTRKSSRPISPTASSFGAKIRNGPATSSAGSALIDVSVNGLHEQSRPTTPLATPPMLALAHITTPPTAYVSALQSRQPPPPSPYRPTTVSDRRPIPSLESLPGDVAPRPPRGTSLFETPTAPGRSTMAPNGQVGPMGPGPDVPMVNIIPATPQEGIEEFNALPVAGTWRKRRASQTSLEESAVIHKPVAVRAGAIPDTDGDLSTISLADVSESAPALPPIPHVSSLPNLNMDLEFSPFNPDVALPLIEAPSGPLPPSPPFQSYSSLPSLESQHSMPSSASEDTMHTSTSVSSLMSFPDVEEALGSMLASLSDAGPLPRVESDLEATPKPNTKHVAPAPLAHGNPGLGLGLDLPSTGSITAPLSVSPKRRPPPLDLSAARKINAPSQATAPPCINHRVAFYKSAKAHPNSPASGTFRSPQSATFTHSYQASISSIGSESSSGSSSSRWRDSTASVPEGLPYDQSRDSISLASEASDDDLHTASIISLTPMMGERGVMQVAQEEVLGEEVGLAF